VVPPTETTIVLVVEDDTELRAFYRSTLRAAGYAVVAVEDGFDALRFAEQTVPSAVVLDLGLLRVAGADVQRELAAHARTADVPIIVVTGQSGTINEQDYACVLRKPIHAHELVAAVERCLARSRRVANHGDLSH
jgi:DNA-binding response OmpR family regulator